MTTATVIRPAGTLQPRHPIRQIAFVAIFLVAGLSLGMLLDTGRTSSGVDLGGADQLPALNANRTAELRLADLYNSQHLLVPQQPEAIGTMGATYDLITGTAVLDSAIGDAMTAELLLADLYDSQHLLVPQQPEAIDTRGATYDPITGTVVLDSAIGDAMTAELRLADLHNSQHLLAPQQPVDTRGATYDPIRGTVVFD